jgi:hypothetical protein
MGFWPILGVVSALAAGFLWGEVRGHDAYPSRMAATGMLSLYLHVGEIAVSGPDLARSLTDLGLIDEYRLYFHPVVLGRGKPFFAGPRPPLRLVASDLIGEDVIRLTYVPA